MAEVGVKVAFDGRDVQTGLQRLKGSAQAFAGALEKKLSFKGVAGSVLGGLGLASGFAVAEKGAAIIAGHWERAAAAAQEIANASDRATAAVVARVRINETPEQEVTRLEKESAGLRANQSGPTLRESVVDTTLPPSLQILAKAAGLVRSPEEQNKARAEADAKIAENDFRVAELKKSIAAKEAADLRAGVALVDQLNAAKEKNALDELSDMDRANALRERIRSLRENAGNGEQGIRDRIEAEALVPQERAAREAAMRTPETEKVVADLGPSIVATSLARIGGGGNIGAFGGGDAALAEARRGNALLQQIAANTARGGVGHITLAPASDVGN